jgi:cohesin loading factor subunit SCC2
MKETAEDMDSLTAENNRDIPIMSSSAAALQQAELKKDILHSLIGPKSHSEIKHLEGILDDKSAALVARYLASSRAFSRSFDIYLQQLIRVLSEPEVRMRTRAMKALSSIIDADPSILSRPDMQRAVQYRFMDQSTLVREAAVDLLGRSVLSRPELTAQYYDMLSERILDTGVSVRKRVIKILKDICVLQPQFPRTSEICVKMMRRISDEEGIKQLVSSVFRELWFTSPPTGASQQEALERRVLQMSAVVGSCKEYEWFEQLLEQLLKTDDKGAVKVVLEVSQLMVDCLVESLLTLDETSATAQGQAQGASSSRLVTCITTLFLFCKTRPSLLLRHATTLHPYLSSKCSSQGDIIVLHYVAQILRQVVPLMDHPSERFLASLEEDLVKLVMKHGQMIVQSCIHCLGAVVNSVTHNYTLVRDCFQKFFMLLEKVKALHSQNSQNSQLKALRPSLLRSAFTVGLLCKHFDVDSFMPSSTQENPVSGRVFCQLVYFSHHEDEDVQLKAVTGLGFYCVRYPERMLEQASRDLYSSWLARHASSKKKCQVLRNLQHHLKEVETTLKVADVHGSDKQEDRENLLEFGDQQSNVSSNIAQAFLSAVLDSFLDTELQVRLGAVQVLLLIMRQGLVHPEQCVPYLITISTDPETSVRVKANQQLSEHSSRYGHFVQTTLMAGVKKSYAFHNLLFGDEARGYLESGSSPAALLSHLYSLIRSNKQHRRALLRALLRYFEDYERNPLGLLLYLADNLAYLPYSTLEEPLFVVHHVDMTISVSGSNIFQAFREALGGSGAVPEEENDDIEHLSQRGCDMAQLADSCRCSHACFLLLLLKQHLKRMYGLTDAKCQQYSPTESNKAYDKTVNRRPGVTFEPHSVLEELKQGPQAPPRVKEDYLKQYVEFKQLMSRLDPFEEEEDSDGGRHSHSVTPAPPSSLQTTQHPPNTKTSMPLHSSSHG